MEVTLLPFQKTALQQTEQMNRVAFYWEMGTGKTFIGAEKLMSMRKRINLVVCQKSKIQDWIDHFETFYDDFPYLLEVLDLTDKKKFARFMEAVNEDDEDVLDLDPCQYIGIINYDLIFRRPSLLKLTDHTILFDESSVLQNQKSKRTSSALEFKPANVILLSGTPTGGKYENLWAQCQLLGWTISESLYWNQFVDYEKVKEGKHFRKNIVGYKNVDRLKSKLRSHGAQFLKSEDVLELPEQIDQIIRIPVTKEYRKFMENRIITVTSKGYEFHDESDFDGQDVTERFELVGNNPLKKLLYARQLCGQYNQNKLDAFKDLLDSTSDRLVVFYNFNDELDKLKRLCQDRPVSEINGKTKDLTAYDNHSDSVTFVQYQAGAMGLNLQKANKIVFFTLPLSSELFEQSKKRIHRIGQSQRCFYYYLMVNKSVEHQILNTLQMRKDFTDDLFKEEEQ